MLTIEQMKKEIFAARGKTKADLVIKNVRVLDIFNGEYIPGDIAIVGEKIVGIGEEYEGIKEIDGQNKVAVPGFIEPHIHIESSYITPGEFIKTCLKHGTTCAFVDPHEVGNSGGVEAIKYIEKFVDLPFDLQIWVPSCVPASKWEDCFKPLEAEEIKREFYNPEQKRYIGGLAEFMDYESVIEGRDSQLAKIRDAHNLGYIIDGHLPKVDGKRLNAYLSQQIRAEHEGRSWEECKKKLSRGCQILLRYGDRSHNLLENIKLVNDYNAQFCSLTCDDINANVLWNEGHINRAYKAAKQFVDPIIALRMGTINTARFLDKHYDGAIAPGYKANIVLVDNIDDYNVSDTICKGIHAYSNGEFLFDDITVETPKSIFMHKHFVAEDFEVNYKGMKSVNAIKAIKGQSECDTVELTHDNVYDLPELVSKVSIIDRYNNYEEFDNFTALITNFGLKEGAVAQTVNHDSHNTLVVGRNDSDMAAAINRIKEIGGGIVFMNKGKVVAEWKLPVCGLMSEKSAEEVGKEWQKFDDDIMPFIEGDRMSPILQMRGLGLTVAPGCRISLHGLINVDKDEIWLKNTKMK